MAFFKTARSVWAKNLLSEKNIIISFKTIIKLDNSVNTILLLAACNSYRLFLNQKFISYGPARTAKGYARVEKIPLKLESGDNILIVEVYAFNEFGYSDIVQPPFLQAELFNDKGRTIASTNGLGSWFTMREVTEHMQDSIRYSYQRPHGEGCWLFTDKYKKWHSVPEITGELPDENEEEAGERIFLDRIVPFPEFNKIKAKNISFGSFEYDNKPLSSPRNLTEKINPIDELKNITEIINITGDKGSTVFSKGECRLYSLPRNMSGLIGVDIKVKERMTLYVGFDERCFGNDIKFDRMPDKNLLSLTFMPGEYNFLTAEVYGAMYIKIWATDSCELIDVYMVEYANPVCKAEFSSSDQELNEIFEAAKHTYAANAVDLYIDCPTRERGGYIGDSLFTSRTEKVLTGESIVEKEFLNNFLLAEHPEKLPKGVIPMCYPADHPDGLFIPGFNFLLVIELYDYLLRTGDIKFIIEFKEDLYEMFKYYKGFENEFGLLENLQSWVFVEWSECSQYTAGVHFPTNMLYARALEYASFLYGDLDFCERSDKLKKSIIEISYNGKFFTDNAIRNEFGKLKSTGNMSEICQCYSFWCGIASKSTFSELWKKLVEDFGVFRNETTTHPLIKKSVLLFGFMTRFDFLSRYGQTERLYKEFIKIFGHMAKLTGTLWEHLNTDTIYSCCHGFASSAAYIIMHDIVGIEDIDIKNRIITLRFSQGMPEEIHAKLPIDKDFITIDIKNGKKDFTLPNGFTAIVIKG